jgi:TM2 domain-containing membrane protein YozV
MQKKWIIGVGVILLILIVFSFAPLIPYKYQIKRESPDNRVTYVPQEITRNITFIAFLREEGLLTPDFFIPVIILIFIIAAILFLIKVIIKNRAHIKKWLHSLLKELSSSKHSKSIPKAVYVVKEDQKHGIPALFSFFIPGLGQIIKGQVGKGILIFFGMMILSILLLKNISFFTILGIITSVRGSPQEPSITLLFLIIATPILWLWNIYDAYNSN